MSKRFTAAVLAMAIAGLSACGGSDGDSADTSSADSSSTTVAGAAPAAATGGAIGLCDLVPPAKMAAAAAVPAISVSEPSFYADNPAPGASSEYCVYRVSPTAQTSSVGVSIVRYPAVADAQAAFQKEADRTFRQAYRKNQEAPAGADEAIAYHGGGEGAALLRFGAALVNFDFGYNDVSKDASFTKPKLDALVAIMVTDVKPKLA